MRVAILGNSGSGKSTLAKKLSGDSSLPSLDLDTIYWEPSQVAIERKTSDRDADLRRFCSDHDHWLSKVAMLTRSKRPFLGASSSFCCTQDARCASKTVATGPTKLASTPQKRNKIGD